MILPGTLQQPSKKVPALQLKTYRFKNKTTASLAELLNLKATQYDINREM